MLPRLVTSMICIICISATCHAVTSSWIVFVVDLVAITFLIFNYELRVRITSKKLWLDHYLKQSSQLRELLKGNGLAYAFSFLIAVPLSLWVYVSYIALSTSELIVLVATSAVCVCIIIYLRSVLREHFRYEYAYLTINRLAIGLSTVFALAALVLTNLISDFTTNYGPVSQEDLADRVCQEIRHVSRPFEFISRFLRYFDYRVLKFRDETEHQVGWTVYLLLLIPNTLTIYGTLAICLGATEIPSRARGTDSESFS